jgi:hypothetical protein
MPQSAQYYPPKQLNQLIGESTMQEVNTLSASIGRSILVANITDMICTDTCIYSSWDVVYGICHCMYLIASDETEKNYWKELRSYFLYKKNGICGIMYQD